jgi:hypothetical protein
VVNDRVIQYVEHLDAIRERAATTFKGWAVHDAREAWTQFNHQMEAFSTTANSTQAA